ncbi:GSCOCG00003112001-RA-CDS, partial [Cotesia congregata]
MDLTDKNIEDSFEKFGALYAWSTSIFIFQLLALTWFTGRIRVRTQTIHSAEDKVWMKNEKITLCVSGGGHPDVDRIRSIHFNDLTLIISWLLIIPFWLLTSPKYTTAFVFMNLFLISKIFHTVLYMKLIVSPIFLKITLITCYVLIII